MTCNDNSGAGTSAQELITNWANSDWTTFRNVIRPTTLQELVNAVIEGEELGGVKCVGSKWSFEEVALSDDVQIDIAALNNVLNVHNTQSLPSTNLSPIINPEFLNRRLVHVEAGVVLKDLLVALDNHALSISTMGSGGGQTLAGVFSTGSHGANFDRPPVADFIHALHFVGPQGQEYWIEPESGVTEAGNNELISALNLCQDILVIRDTQIYEAALVSMGRMGVIYSVIIEVKPQLKIEEIRKPWVGGWSDISSILRDVANSRSPGFENTPLHAPIHGSRLGFPPDTFNPIESLFTSTELNSHLQIITPFYSDDAYTTARWETPMDEGPNIPAPSPPYAMVLKGLLAFIRPIVDGVESTHNIFRSHVIDGMNSAVESQFKFAAARDVSHKIWDQHDYNEPYRSHSFEVFFNAKETKYLDFILRLKRELGVIPLVSGVIALRFMQATRAMLGMQQWSLTVSIEIAVLQGLDNNNRFLGLVRSLVRGYEGILHWGQLHDQKGSSFRAGTCTYSSLDGESPPDLLQWRTILEKLHGNSLTFSSAWSRRIGLEPITIQPTYAHVKETPYNTGGRYFESVNPRGPKTHGYPMGKSHSWGKDHEILWENNAFRGKRYHVYQSVNGPYACYGGLGYICGDNSNNTATIVNPDNRTDIPSVDFDKVEWYVDISTSLAALERNNSRRWEPVSEDTLVENGSILRLAVSPTTPKTNAQIQDASFLEEKLIRYYYNNQDYYLNDPRVSRAKDMLDCWSENRVFNPVYNFGLTSFYFYRVKFKSTFSANSITSDIHKFYRRYNTLSEITTRHLILNIHTGVIHLSDASETNHMHGMFESRNALVLSESVEKYIRDNNVIDPGHVIGSIMNSGGLSRLDQYWVPRRRDIVRLPNGPKPPSGQNIEWGPPQIKYIPSLQLRERMKYDDNLKKEWEEKNKRKARFCSYCFRRV